MSMYYEMINARAKATYTGPDLGTPNMDYNIWVYHWFATCELIHDEFVAAGLTNTATYLRDLIERDKKYHYPK